MTRGSESGLSLQHTRDAAFAEAVGARRPRAIPGWMLRLGGRKVAVLTASRRVSSQRFREATGWEPEHHDAVVGLKAMA